MKTRKRRRSKNENSQSSSNSVEIKRRNCKIQNKTRKSKEMSGRDLDLTTHHHTYVDLLEQVCSGEDQSMGSFRNNVFWNAFADKLCMKIGDLRYKPGMDLACQHYCDGLKASYKQLKKEGGPNRINGISQEYWAKLTRIFGGRTPSTSTRRSSRSTASTSSTSSSGLVKKLDLCQALAKLVFFWCNALR